MTEDELTTVAETVLENLRACPDDLPMTERRGYAMGTIAEMLNVLGFYEVMEEFSRMCGYPAPERMNYVPPSRVQ